MVAPTAHHLHGTKPTSALAEHSVQWLFGLIKRLRAGGACIVFTSHRWNEIKGIADRITVFRNGEWVATSAATELSEGDAVERMTGQRLDVLFPKPAPVASQTAMLEVGEVVRQGFARDLVAARTGEVLGIGGLAGRVSASSSKRCSGSRRGRAARCASTAARRGCATHRTRSLRALRSFPKTAKSKGCCCR